MKKFLLIVTTVLFVLSPLFLDAGGWNRLNTYEQKNSGCSAKKLRQIDKQQKFAKYDPFIKVTAADKKQVRSCFKKRQQSEQEAEDVILTPQPFAKNPLLSCLLFFMCATVRSYAVMRCPVTEDKVRLRSAQAIAQNIAKAGFKRFAYMSDLPWLLGNKTMNGCEVWAAFSRAKRAYFDKYKSSLVRSLKMNLLEKFSLSYDADDIVPAIFGYAPDPWKRRRAKNYSHVVGDFRKLGAPDNVVFSYAPVRTCGVRPKNFGRVHSFCSPNGGTMYVFEK